MKVTVKDKFLNVRFGKPSVNAPCYQYLAPGSEIEVDGKLYKGDKFGDSEINTWFRDKAGNYYWSGGVSSIFSNTEELKSSFQPLVDSKFDGTRLQSPINYNALLNIDNSIKARKGQGVTIAILDHPLSMSIDSTATIIRPFHTQDSLFNYHSNFIAGLIAGTKALTGVASNCKLLELPMFTAEALTDEANLEASLKFIHEQDEPMIINISLGLQSKYNAAIRNFPSNKIVVACAGIDYELTRPITRHPASLPNVITVGAINKRPGLLPSLDPKVDFVLPNFGFISYGASDMEFVKEQGDSYSCAVVSAVIALLISSGKAGYELTSIKNALAGISASWSNESAFNTFNLIKAKE
ncbi:S8/S53 family peptidase [Paraflavisolibacter sp. H34]|uniref:S8/S53 family peptidase n=1 Tax=Huijunlia imazamoxiresistens TaxID=3127457 RepID=UPI003018F17F